MEKLTRLNICAICLGQMYVMSISNGEHGVQTFKGTGLECECHLRDHIFTYAEFMASDTQAESWGEWADMKNDEGNIYVELWAI